jgi:hypothetical protein
MFGATLAVGDFDMDGYDDLAIGAPGEGSGVKNGTGIVNVLYGSSTGLIDAGNQMWHQDTIGIIGASEKWDFFGSALAVGDFDMDGYDDLAIGAPGEGIGIKFASGVVNVIYGSSAGLTATDNQMWHQDVGSIIGICEVTDMFGATLAVGDFDMDGYDDLAIGAPGEGIGTRIMGQAPSTGAVNILYGSSTGLIDTGNQMWHQDTIGILGASEQGDYYGSALAVGDFDMDGYDDLAVGVPFEGIGKIYGAGAMNLLYGSSAGLSSTDNVMWYQDVGTVMGICESWDKFGAALAVGDFDMDGYDDVAIGVPNESIETIRNAGAVNVLYGTSTGLLDTGNQMWHQDVIGILGLSEKGDLFG